MIPGEASGSWQVTIFQPLIWYPCGSGQLPAQRQDNYIQVKGFDSTNSRCILPACSSSCPPPSSTYTHTHTPPPLLPPILTSGPARNRCPWKIYRPHMWLRTLTNLKKKRKKKAEAHPETWKSWTMLYIIIIGMAATGNIPLNIQEDNGRC